MTLARIALAAAILTACTARGTDSGGTTPDTDTDGVATGTATGAVTPSDTSPPGTGTGTPTDTGPSLSYDLGQQHQLPIGGLASDTYHWQVRMNDTSWGSISPYSQFAGGGAAFRVGGGGGGPPPGAPGSSGMTLLITGLVLMAGTVFVLRRN